MKKLLLVLLLLPITSLAQLSGPTAADVADGEGAAGLVFLGTTENANESIGNVQVNDTIVLGFKLTNWLSGTNSITYAHIDFQYNKNAYTYIDETYMASSGNPQNTSFEQNGYKLSVNNNYEAFDIWSQWRYGNYTSNSDWNIVHLQTQVTSGDLADLDYYVKFRLKVHDAGENHEYTDNVFVTMGKIDDNAASKNYDPVYAYEKQDLSLEPEPDIDVAGVTVKLEMGSNVDLTEFTAVPVVKDPTNNSWNAIIQGDTFWVTVPSNGSIDFAPYLTDSNAEYAVVWQHGKPSTTDNTFKTLYEDILTISDVQLALKELAQHGEGAINAGVSLFNADVHGGTSFFGDGNIDSNDTYKLLAHVTGIEELYIDWDTDGDIDSDDANNQSPIFFRTFDGTTYTSTTAASYAQNGITHAGGLVELDIDFTNETSSQVFQTYGTWKGDVNLSHSPEVNNSIANSAKSVTSYGSTKRVVDTNFSSFNVVEDGDRVIATILLPNTTDLSAAQYRLTYDDTRLEFVSVETDSGNESTNFAKHTENRINVGSINMLGGRLDDTKYEVVFTKKQTINGVAGLVTLTNTDGANTEAERVEIKIE